MELGAAGFKAYYVETLASALGVMAQWQFDAALVDADELCNEISEAIAALRDESQIPILAILRSQEEDQLLNVLAAGATQVLPQSSSPRVIAAQLHRLVEAFRPRLKDDTGRMQVGPLWLNPRRSLAAVEGVDVKLTTSEFELLLLLASEAGELVHRDTIGRTLRFETAAERRRSADMHISRIRRKMKAAGCERIEIVTVYGQGYMLQVAPEKLAVSEPSPRIEWTV